MPPSVNNYWKPVVDRSGRFAKIILTAEAAAYRSIVQVAIMMQQRARFGQSKIVVETHIHPKKVGSDIDNFKKALYDGLTHGGVWDDDKHIIKESTHMRKSIKGGFVVVDIREATEAEIEDTKTHEIKRPARGWSWE